MSQLGCQYVVSHTKRWNAKEKCWDDVPVHCSKIPGENDDHCPKHRLFAEDEKEEKKRRSLKAIQTRNWNTIKKEALKSSPLAAYNPAFDEDDQPKGYSQ